MVDASGLMIEVLKTHSDSSKWVGAQFEHIKRVSNSKVGEVGQDFIERLCKAYNFDCIFPTNAKGEKQKQSPWDIKVEGVTFELKTATEDVSRSFQFNHIRYHRKYDAVICLGVGPQVIFFNVWSKADITTGNAGNMVSMEKAGNASYKLTKKATNLLPIDNFQEVMSKFLMKFKVTTAKNR